MRNRFDALMAKEQERRNSLAKAAFFVTFTSLAAALYGAIIATLK